jgi:hypothetical protein
MKAYTDIMYFQQYDNYKEWMSKYHPTGEHFKDEYLDSFTNFFAVGNAFQSTGLLVSQGIVDSELVYEQEGELIISLWERMKPIIVGRRADYEYQNLFPYFESLYEQMKQIKTKRHPELST